MRLGGVEPPTCSLGVSCSIQLSYNLVGIFYNAQRDIIWPMRLEHEIVNELGPQNWLDSVAGEAVILGHSLNDPYLVAKGTELSLLIRQVAFDNDSFSRVEALGIDLLREVAKRKVKETLFIDELYVGSKKEKSCNDWEYDLILADGRYQIMMLLPEYFGNDTLKERKKMEIESQVQLQFSGLENCRRETKEDKYESQVFESVTCFDINGKEIYKTIDFNHEGRMLRGRIEYYFFDEIDSAMMAWQVVRRLFISDQKR